jgi:hypothetical protein
MKIMMTETMRGASNKEGTASMEYVAGQAYEMAAPWQASLAQVFIDNEWATLETKAEKKPAKKRASKKKAD